MSQETFNPSDFFARQDAARAKTSRLALWFALALAGTVAAVYAAAIFCFGAIGGQGRSREIVSLWDPKIFCTCLVVTIVVVGGASLFKSLQLSGGGDSVAESVGGRKVDPDTREPQERRLLNIVEEMSIASGMPVPDVYILDNESAINAFAAGDSIENAAVAVTRGALEKLSRDELQAVMGHEFSHILNGDMRLNIRLIGWIFGLLALTVVGRVLFQAAPVSRSRDDREGGGNSGMVFVLFGLLVLAIGYVGYFFAQIIQASISRQREHLADASATQFTRNPEALASALRRIAGDSAGTRLENPHASEVAHMCFGEGTTSPFATHPPLEQRIRLLKPDWDGTPLPPLSRNSSREDRAPARTTTAPMAAFAAAGTGPHLKRDGESAGDSAPDELQSLVRDPLGARATALLLIMSDNPSDNNAQAILLKKSVSPDLFAKLKSSWSLVSGIPGRQRLELLRRAAPALRKLNVSDARELTATLHALADLDGSASFFEISLIRLTEALLHPSRDEAEETSAEKLRPAFRSLLGALAKASGETTTHSDGLSRALAKAPDFAPVADLPAISEMTAGNLEEAFRMLASASFSARAQVMAAAESFVMNDGKINDAEHDLLIALAATLRCPGR